MIVDLRVRKALLMQFNDLLPRFRRNAQHIYVSYLAWRVRRVVRVAGRYLVLLLLELFYDCNLMNTANCLHHLLPSVHLTIQVSSMALIR